MSCSIVDHDHTGHRFVSLRPRLLKCSKFPTENSVMSQTNDLPAEVPHLHPLPRLEYESHGKDIRA